VGGGGHKAAAGAVVGGSAEEVRGRLLAIIEELYGGSL
jgi:nanoRNase/pAp phosphatase (c-di-AMP/oligoRNAs hydrolase)